MSGIIAQNTLDNSGLIKSPAGGGAWNFIKKLTASSDATLSFVNGTSDVVLDSTYKEYIFTFNNMHVSGSSAYGFTFQGSEDTGSSYGVTLTSTQFYTYHGESAGDYGLTYNAGYDAAQSTSFIRLFTVSGVNNDSAGSGQLHLFNPSSTTFVKHFISNCAEENTNYIEQVFVGGYFNTTSAVDAIQFKSSTGTIDAGDICLYGITT